MARLPQVGGDSGNWGEILNEYLEVSISDDGTLKTGVVGGAQVQNNSITPSKLTNVGVAGGLATLDEDSVLSSTQVPQDLKDGLLNNSQVIQARNDAQAAAADAETAVTDAETAATNAANSATTAGNRATAASDSATAAADSATAANTSAGNASTSATNASTARTAAETARDETIVTVDSQTSWTGAVSLTNAQSKSKYIRRLLTGNATVTLAAGDAGRAYSCTLELQQDATGSRTATLVNVATPYGVAIPLSTTANNTDVIRLEWNGTRWSAFVAGPQMSVPSAWVV